MWVSSILRRGLKAHFKAGGLIAYPTAFCFALGCDPWNPKAIKKLLKFKNRPKRKGLIIIAHQYSYLAPFSKPLSFTLYQKSIQKWPDQHTWLFPSHPHVLPLLRGEHCKIALRLERYKPSKKTCQILKSALVSTSLNRGGHMPIKTYKEACRQFGGKKIWIIPGRSGQTKRPSTIQDIETGIIYR